MKKITAVKQKFSTYPNDVAVLLNQVRDQIYLAAHEHDISLEESLKWGEPSYGAKGGSAVRFDWKAKHPDQYAVYFNCQTNLVETFREVYPDLFTFEGNRAMVFQNTAEVSWPAFRHCVAMSLQYHNLKHLPLLGA